MKRLPESVQPRVETLKEKAARLRAGRNRPNSVPNDEDSVRKEPLNDCSPAGNGPHYSGCACHEAAHQAEIAQLHARLRQANEVRDHALEVGWRAEDRVQELEQAASAPVLYKSPLIYTHADMTLAMEGCTSRVTDEVTDDVIRRVSAWLMARSRELAPHDAADELETAALDLRDGEWRRPIKGGA